jgi:hypothetical protein
MTVIESAMASTSSSLCEMKMAVTPSAVSSQRSEQVVDLVGNEHRRGLVEDEDAGAPEEHLDDLDALALADPEILDQVVGVQAETILVGQLDDAGARRLEVDHAVMAGLVAEDDVLGDGEVLGEHEVLMHHADADRDASPT